MNAELGGLALDVARDAAAHIRDSRPDGRVAVTRTKSSPTDVVTAIDQATEHLIRSRITARRPDDAFLGEEGGVSDGTSGVTWIVDPIDGTVNFMYGLPGYAVSIAASVGGDVVAGCVVNVTSGEEYTATAGAGAYLRSSPASEPVPIRAVAPPDLAHALVGTGFNYVLETRVRQAAAVAELLRSVRDVRRIGSAAVDLCSVAAGRLDAYVEQGLKPWDLAAGGLIAREAGVLLAGLDGGPDERLTIAAPAEIAEEFFDLVRACGF